MGLPSRVAEGCRSLCGLTLYPYFSFGFRGIPVRRSPAAEKADLILRGGGQSPIRPTFHPVIVRQIRTSHAREMAKIDPAVNCLSPDCHAKTGETSTNGRFLRYFAPPPMLPVVPNTCYASHMTHILLTAFEAYEPWKKNASWLSLIELTRDLPSDVEITTRLYPVDVAGMKQKLCQDLKNRYDFVFHVGQSPGSSCICLEEVALNIVANGHSVQDEHAAVPVCESGPASYHVTLPVRDWAQKLREAGIPARVSFHAGTYLCNAILYWSHRLAEDLQLQTQSTFVHIPLDTSQVLELDEPTPFMPSSMVADALRRVLSMATQEVRQGSA